MAMPAGSGYPRSAGARSQRDGSAAGDVHSPPSPGMQWVPGGAFRMGSDHHFLEEAPAHRVWVDGFWMDEAPVTNARFARFVAETGYVTFAELEPRGDGFPQDGPGLPFAGSRVFVPPPAGQERSCAEWRYVQGACWRRPQGEGSSIEGLAEHPVVHVTYGDAEAFADWDGKSLPTEAEWEYAARGGLDSAEFAWGDEITPGGRHMANTWQGDFPALDSGDDGHAGVSPVGSFPPNAYGLRDLIGNVWEWTSDWYMPGHEADAGDSQRLRCNPRGPRVEDSFDIGAVGVLAPRRVLKGGSYLSAPARFPQFRPAARLASPIDMAACHIGFRCVVRARRGQG